MANKQREQIYDRTLANRLAIFRTQHISKSQNKAAKLLKVAQSTLSYMESGRMAIRFDFIRKLIIEFNLNGDWFAKGTGMPTEKKSAKPNPSTDINALNNEILQLHNGIKILEIKQNLILERMEQMKKELAAYKAKETPN